MDTRQLYQLFQQSKRISTDTRKEIRDTIFFALKGENFNGNLFAGAALEKGAAYAVVDEVADNAIPKKYGDRFILVNDALKTLQQLAAHHRRQFRCPVLAITGSNGKTTTKELLAAVILKKYRTGFTQGNLNNHIGIPQTLLSIGLDMEFVIIEMGANHQGEIASYCEYVQPDYGLITNVGLAHVEGFGGFQGVIKGKTELYRYLAAHGGKVFVSADNDILMEKSAVVSERITYGRSADAYCRGVIIDSANGTLRLRVFGKPDIEIATHLAGQYNFENVMSAVCVARYFGVPDEQIREAISDYQPTNNRSQIVRRGSNTIVMDAYNANPSSMVEALKNFGEMAGESKVVILGEMLELGEYADEEHRKIADMALAMKLTHRVFTGAGFAFMKDVAGALFFTSTADIKDWLAQQRFENTLLLVKGSRKNKLDELFG